MLYDAWADSIRRLWDGATAAHGWGLWECAADPDGTGWRIVTLSGDVVASGIRDERTARLLAAVPDLCEPSLRPVDCGPTGVGVAEGWGTVVAQAHADGVTEGWEAALDLDDVTLRTGWYLLGSPASDVGLQVVTVDPDHAAGRAALEAARPAVLAEWARLGASGVTDPAALWDAMTDALGRVPAPVVRPTPYEYP